MKLVADKRQAAKAGECRDFRCRECPVRAVALCGQLDADGLSVLEPELKRYRVKAGDIVLAPGDQTRDAMTVVEGIAAAYAVFPGGRRQILGFTHPGAMVLPMRPEKSLRVTVEALTAATLCRMGGLTLDRLRAEYPTVRDRMLEEVGGQLVSGQVQQARLGQASAVEKVASFLLELAERYGQREAGRWAIPVPVRRLEIADYLGLKVETVSRAFGALRSAGAIELTSVHVVVVEDLDVLRECAAGFGPVPTADARGKLQTGAAPV